VLYEVVHPRTAQDAPSDAGQEPPAPY